MYWHVLARHAGIKFSDSSMMKMKGGKQVISLFVQPPHGSVSEVLPEAINVKRNHFSGTFKLQYAVFRVKIALA